MGHFIWNLDPEIFRLGNFAPRYYGLLFALGFLVSFQLMQRVYQFEKKDIESLSSLLFHMMVGTIVGARLGHTLFYEPEFYLSHPLEILFIWKGGLASHGGTIGVMLAVWLYCKKHLDQPYIWIADRLAPSIAFTAGCIRVGNFFNSEILGKASDVPWAIVFERVDQIPRHPAMLYEAASYFVLFGVLQWNYNRLKPNVRAGLQIGIMMIWIFTSRFLIEFIKENQVAFEDSMVLNMGQLLSIPFILFGIFMVSGAFKNFVPSSLIEPRKPSENTHK